MQIDKRLWAAAFALGMLGMAGSARAQYSGTGIEVSNTCANTATQANFTACASGAGTVHFSASGLDFSSYGNIGNTGNASADYTFGSWLGSLGYASSEIYSSSLLSTTSLAGSSGTGGAMFDFTGSALFTNGQTFTVTHDDGVTFEINNIVVLGGAANVGGTSENCSVGTNFSDCIDGPTSPTSHSYTFTGTTGTYGFNFAYAECCGAPAVFETNLAPVPEPASIMFLGTIVLGIGTALRRKVAQKS
jgi:hypothetical protein